MKCKKCSTPLVERQGKHGEFLACPKSNPTDNHGTVSIPRERAGGSISHWLDYPVSPLDDAIARELSRLGIHLSDLDRFIEDDSWMEGGMY